MLHRSLDRAASCNILAATIDNQTEDLVLSNAPIERPKTKIAMGGIFVSSARTLLLLAFASTSVVVVTVGSSLFVNYPVSDCVPFSSLFNKPPTLRDETCVDPYKLPGYLYTPPDNDNYQLTSYIPFYDSLYDASDPSFTTYPWPGKSSPDLSDPHVEPEFLKMAPHSWMTDLAEHAKLVDAAANGQDHDAPRLQHLDKYLAWMRNKRVLMIADSVDRYMMVYFCQELSLTATVKARHTTAWCTIPHLNFTIYHWHLAGYYNYRPNWWWQATMEQVTFEDRYEKMFKRTLGDVVGENGRAPDLVLYQSGLWDQVTFAQKYAHEPDGEFSSLNEQNKLMDRQLTWAELRFYMTRQKQFIRHVKGVFGNDTRIVYRSLIPHQQLDERDLMIMNMDRASRIVAHKEGAEVMDWARLVAGFSSQYKDHVHVDKGPMSWLYQNMLMSYVFRLAGGVEHLGVIEHHPMSYQSDLDPWLECHDVYVAKAVENR
ncbi:hypothetical protein V1507DRAFT_462177 [Lipomyces tetrasporus]